MDVCWLLDRFTLPFSSLISSSFSDSQFNSWSSLHRLIPARGFSPSQPFPSPSSFCSEQRGLLDVRICLAWLSPLFYISAASHISCSSWLECTSLCTLRRTCPSEKISPVSPSSRFSWLSSPSQTPSCAQWTSMPVSSNTSRSERSCQRRTRASASICPRRTPMRLGPATGWQSTRRAFFHWFLGSATCLCKHGDCRICIQKRPGRTFAGVSLGQCGICKAGIIPRRFLCWSLREEDHIVVDDTWLSWGFVRNFERFWNYIGL